ncbi:MAG: S-layer homology domain-containing protein, partial [Clostridia bacterium]|nr:S-layer homology domain-containing protein [Clostridia bacterium]
MKKLKTITASILAFIMILSLTTNIGIASVSSDVKDTQYKTYAQVLGALEIMVGDAGTGAFRPDDDIKRSEMTKIGIALMGLFKSAQTSQKSEFPDVAEDYWAKGFINSAKAHGLVIGDDTGLFRPEDKIKFSEVLAVLIRALGYEVQAKSKGGFPAGYVSVASSIGLSKGVSASSDYYVSRGDVAIMAYNALRINLMEQTGFGSNIKYEITDKTLLKDKLDVSLIQGKVQAVGSSVLDGKAALSKNEIRIGDKNYDAGKTDTRTILGFNADAYYSNKTKKIIAIVPTENANSVITVQADAIEKLENSLSSKALHYWKNPETSAKSTKLTLENDAVVVYNGKIAGNEKFAMIDTGYISLLDSDSDGKYDIVFVNEVVNFVVDDVLASSGKITDKYTSETLKLDFDDEDKTVIIELGGEYITLSQLKEWDVISFTISEDDKVIFGNVIRDSLSGKVTEIGDEHIYVGDKKLKIALSYTKNFTIGDEGTFYLDAQGKIAAFDGELQKNDSYAYLENMAIGSGMGKTLKFEIFTEKGEFETLEAAEKITVNSSKNLTHQAAMSAIGSTKQLITYEKDSSGKIKKIVTGKSSSDINKNEFTLNMDE